jgi:hypothetical protein
MAQCGWRCLVCSHQNVPERAILERCLNRQVLVRVVLARHRTWEDMPEGAPCLRITHVLVNPPTPHSLGPRYFGLCVAML